KSGRVQRLIQPVTTAVAGEDTAGAVPAVRGRRQADDEEPRPRVAEARHRPAPVFPVAVAFDLLACHLFAVSHEPGAESAAGDLVLKLDKRSRAHKIAGRKVLYYLRR